MYEIKTIDNFLDTSLFNSIQELVLGNEIPWYMQSSIAIKDDNMGMYFTHLLHTSDTKESYLKPKFLPILDYLKPKELIRIKLNCYPRSDNLERHPPHVDYNTPHKGCIIAMNTCNGYTEFEDGRKFESIANRALLFDPSIKQNSTNCTDDKARINININYN